MSDINTDNDPSILSLGAGDAASAPAPKSSDSAEASAALSADAHDFTDTFFVAIGSSAGGIEALSAMLAGLNPATPHCYFILQHLSPHFTTNLPDILSRVANMPVQIPKHEEQIKPGSIYLLPPGKVMTIFRDKLMLAERAIGAPKDSYPIDSFIESLAAEKGQKAIAVILSGAGSDGSRHLADIKSYNGYVIAQSEDSASFTSMPKRAIQSKQVNAVLPPEDILSHIDSYTAYTVPAITSDLKKKVSRQPEAIERIFFFLNTQYSIDFSCYDESLVISKIDKRLKISGAANYNDYADILAKDLDELESLWDELLASASDTFTYNEKLSKIAEEVFPKLAEFHLESSHKVKIWVVGCHTGEEAYLYAFLLEDYLDKHGLAMDYRIFATDAHAKAVSIASRGVFPQLKITRLPVRVQKKYFVSKDGESTVKTSIRQKIVFAKHNVVSDVPFPRTHLVSCRQLFHNLKEQYQAKVLQSIGYSLNPGGMLVLSHDDNITDFNHPFRRLETHSNLFINESRSSGKPRAVLNPSKPVHRSGIKATSHADFTGFAPPSEYETFEAKLYQELCHQHFKDALVFDGDFEVSFFFGNVSSYLTPISGRANHNLETLIPQEIFHTISTWCASIGATQNGQSFSHSYLRKIPAKGDQHPFTQMIDVYIAVLDSSFEGKPYFYCAFNPQQQPINTSLLKNQILDTLNGEIDALKSQLEYFRKELLLSRDQASATVGELEASNEQLLTSNDQLQSTNEELQSTNEELQAVNEELHLINAEHQNRIADLSEASNEMAQLCDIANIATLYLDQHLIIRKYNRQCSNLLNLLPEDSNRSVTHFASMGLLDLPGSVETVLQSQSPLQKTMTIGNPPKKYQIKLYPHRNIESRLIGVMVVFLPQDDQGKDPLTKDHPTPEGSESTEESWQSV